MENCIALISEKDTSILKSPGTNLSICSIHKSSGYCTSAEGSLFLVRSESISVVPMKTKVSQLSVFNSACLMISYEGLTYAKGEDVNQSGILGIPGIHSLKDFTLIPSLLDNPASQVSLSSNHAAMVDEFGSLWTWGSGPSLGIYENSNDQPPLEVSSARAFRASKVICGEHFTIVCTEEGSVYIYGSLSNHNTPTGLLPQKMPGNFYVSDIAVGDNFLVFLTDNQETFHWEDNNSPVQLPVKKNQTIVRIGATHRKTFGLASNQELYQWTCKPGGWTAKIYKINTEVFNLFSSNGQIGLSVLGDEVHRILIDCIKDQICCNDVVEAYESPKLSPMATVITSESCFLSQDVLESIFPQSARTVTESLASYVSCKFQFHHIIEAIVKLATSRLITAFTAIQKTDDDQLMNIKIFGFGCMENLIQTMIERNQKISIMAGFDKIMHYANIKSIKYLGIYDLEGNLPGLSDSKSTKQSNSNSCALHSSEIFRNEMLMYLARKLCENFKKCQTKNALNLWQLFLKKQTDYVSTFNQAIVEDKDSMKKIKRYTETVSKFQKVICDLSDKLEDKAKEKQFCKWKQFTEMNCKSTQEKSKTRNSCLRSNKTSLDNAIVKKYWRRSFAILYSTLKKRVMVSSSEAFMLFKYFNDPRYKRLSLLVTKLIVKSRFNNLKSSFDNILLSLPKITCFKLIRTASQYDTQIQNSHDRSMKTVVLDKSPMKSQKLEMKLYQRQIVKKMVLQNNISEHGQLVKAPISTQKQKDKRNSTEIRLDYGRFVKSKMNSKMSLDMSSSGVPEEQKMNYLIQPKTKLRKILLKNTKDSKK